MNSPHMLLNIFSLRETPVTQSVLTGRTRVFVLAVIFTLHAAAGFSIADEATTAEPPPSNAAVSWPRPAPWEETVPWPGPVPWPETVPWSGVGPSTGFFTSIGRSMDKAHAMLERN